MSSLLLMKKWMRAGDTSFDMFFQENSFLLFNILLLLR